MPAHFEIHAVDVARARTFYSKVLGWSFSPMPGAGDVEYHLISGPDIGAGHALTGGMMRRMGEPSPSGAPIRGCTLTFEVADVDAVYAKALESGGAEALPPTDMPGVGRFAYCEDGEGNIFGVITPASES